MEGCSVDIVMVVVVCKPVVGMVVVVRSAADMVQVK